MDLLAADSHVPIGLRKRWESSFILLGFEDAACTSAAEPGADDAPPASGSAPSPAATAPGAVPLVSTLAACESSRNMRQCSDMFSRCHSLYEPAEATASRMRPSRSCPFERAISARLLPLSPLIC